MRLQNLLPLFLLAIACNLQNVTSFCMRPNRARLLRLNPSTLFDPTPFGFTHITVDTKNAVAHIAGQVAITSDGQIVGVTLEEQLVLVEQNLRAALRAVRSDEMDIMSMNAYVLNFDPNVDLATFQVFGRNVGSPVTTLISTPALAIEGLLVEVEITAAVGRRGIWRLRCL